MEKKSILILIGALLLAGATAATAYSRSMSPQQTSTNSYVGTTTNTGYGGGMMGGGMMGGMMGRGMMGGGYGGQQPSTTASGSPNGTTGWSWQGMWGWCHGMMSNFGGWFSNQTSSNQTTSPNQISITGYSFQPSILTVQKGTTVTWTNYDSAIHTVESGTAANPTSTFSSGNLSQGQSFSYTFTQDGTFVYHCDLHSSMTGVVIVEG
jgi:plastocyanin